MDINPLRVKYKWTHKVNEADKWLKSLSEYKIIACDFETASKYTDEEREAFLAHAGNEAVPYIERKKAEAFAASTALDHPEHVRFTHLSIATSETDAMVFVLDTPAITRRVLSFLVNTDIKQVWHNAGYDFRLLYYYTGKFPKDYEDSAIFARTLFNHVERQKSRVGLKEIAGFRYGAWGLSEDMFDVSQMYEPTMLQYAATDACATMFVFNRMQESVLPNLESVRSTAENYSPWDQLATFPSPMEHIPEEGYFYHNTGKFLVRDTVRLMMNGLPISLDRVYSLEQDLDKILEDVHSALATNPYVKRYLEAKNKELLDLYIDTQKGKCKEDADFLEEFKASSPVHRSYYMELFAERMGIEFPEEKHPTGVSKWSARLVKKLSARYPALRPLADKTVDPNSPTAVEAMKKLASDKCRMYNANYLALIETPKLKPLVFNPGSPKQKQEIFAMAGLESDAKSATTGEDSWSREQIERVNEETEDEDMRSFTQLLIDYSFAAIIKNTFVPAFYRYSLDEVLYGTYTLFGAKSMRFTSSSPRNNWASREQLRVERTLKRETPIAVRLALGHTTLPNIPQGQPYAKF